LIDIIFTQTRYLPWIQSSLLESLSVSFHTNIPPKVDYYPIKLPSLIFVHLSPAFAPVLVQ
jgi:hypothetical protein